MGVVAVPLLFVVCRAHVSEEGSVVWEFKFGWVGLAPPPFLSLSHRVNR